MSFGRVQIRKTDQLFSRLVKFLTKYKCEHCGKQFKDRDGLELSHYFGRRKESVRLDFENCSSLCNGCHRKFGENPHQHAEWMKKKLGTKYNALLMRANSYKKRDDAMDMLYLQALVKQLEKQYPDIKEELK